MNTNRPSPAPAPDSCDIFARILLRAPLVLLLALATACPAEDPDVAKDAAPVGDGPTEIKAETLRLDGSDGPSTDGLSCPATEWRYDRPGCGDKAPAPVCFAGSMDACGAQLLCTCEGKVEVNCEPWHRTPWAYRMPNTVLGPVPTTCDPKAMPDGGTDAR